MKLKFIKRLTGILTAAAILFTSGTNVFAANDRINGYDYSLNEHKEDNSGLHNDCDKSDNYSVVAYDSQMGGSPPAILEQHKGLPITCLRKLFAHDFDGYYADIIKAPAIPKYVQDLSMTFSGCEFSTPPAIPNMVVDMIGTFNSCRNMTSFPILPNGVTHMTDTFSGCKNVRGTVELPDTVTEIESAFRDCLKLTTIPDISKLTELELAGYAFINCESATGGTDLPNSGLTATVGLFSGCKKMTTPPSVIYDSVTEMSRMFYQCESISGTIDVRATLSMGKPSGYSEAFNGVASADGAELILNYTAQNEAVIDDIISKKTIINNIKKGVLLPAELPPEGGDGDGGGETPPVDPPANSLPVVDGKGSQDVTIQGIVEPINTLDIDVPLSLKFIIDENRDIHYTENAKVVSRSPSPLEVSCKSVTVPSGAPALVADDAFADWDNLTIAQTKGNFAISLNGKNLSTAGVKLGDISSGYGAEANLPLNLSVLYGKQWNNTSQLTFNYVMNLEFALAS